MEEISQSTPALAVAVALQKQAIRIRDPSVRKTGFGKWMIRISYCAPKSKKRAVRVSCGYSSKEAADEAAPLFREALETNGGADWSSPGRGSPGSKFKKRRAIVLNADDAAGPAKKAPVNYVTAVPEYSSFNAAQRYHFKALKRQGISFASRRAEYFQLFKTSDFTNPVRAKFIESSQRLADRNTGHPTAQDGGNDGGGVVEEVYV